MLLFFSLLKSCLPWKIPEPRLEPYKRNNIASQESDSCLTSPRAGLIPWRWKQQLWVLSRSANSGTSAALGVG